MNGSAAPEPRLEWDFPLPEPGTGILMGNGTMGIMVWGGERLHLTVSRNGFWDHRGGRLPHAGATFAALKRLLAGGDHAEASRLFGGERPREAYRKPTQLPFGRWELAAEGWTPRAASVEAAGGRVRVHWEKEGRSAGMVIAQARDRDLAWIECDPALGKVGVRVVPMWEYLGKELAADGVAPPLLTEDGASGGTLLQSLPDDAALAAAWVWRSGSFFLALALPLDGADPVTEACAVVAGADAVAEGRKGVLWWERYWADVPRLSLPDAELQHAWMHGLYLQAGLTGGDVAAGLAGPWMEEHLFPAWRNDYHFNVNLQMIYQPCLPTGRADHLLPLWKRIGEWLPRMRENGKRFFGSDAGRAGALLLPHAVDDRGKTVDDFWTGIIDHGCAAWIAQLAWLHYRYTLDESLLRGTAWPLLRGAFEGYWAMVEEGPGRLRLPVTVSPEYGGSGDGAVGADASYQLAAFHTVASILPRAAAILGEEADPRWERVGRELPPYALAEVAGGGSRVALWEGQDLDESHRHHSHLAALYPFATVDPRSPAHREVMRATLRHWTAKGAGLWAGWSLPWAAAICARCDLSDAAVAWLRWWRTVYTNVGHGSDHNADFSGCVSSSRGYFFPDDPGSRYRPVLQLDAAMGVLTALVEILVQCRGEELVVLPSLPRRWRSFSFDGVRTEGAFVVGATVEAGRLREIRVTSQAGGTLRLRHGLGARCRIEEEGVEGKDEAEGEVIEWATRPGQRLVIGRIS